MGSEERTIVFAVFNMMLWVGVLTVGAFNGTTWLGQFMTVIAFVAALASLVWVATEDRERYHRRRDDDWDDDEWQ